MKFPSIGGGAGNGKQGGTFIKMKDGERLKGVFRGDPHIFKQHWVDRRSHVCQGKDLCEHCAAGDKPKFRFRINFLTQEDGIWIAKIFEQGYGTFKDLKGMHENDYDLEQTCVVLIRSGEGTDTRYQIIPAKQNCTPADFKKIAAIPLNELKDEREVENAGAEVEETADDLPF